MKLLKTKKILVPIDFSEYSWKTFQIAAAIAVRLDLHIELMHVLRPDNFYIKELLLIKYKDLGKKIPEYKEIVSEKIQTEAKNRLFSNKYISEKVDFSILVTEGSPSREILHEIYQSQPDLTVLASRSSSEISEIMTAFLGGTAEKVIRESVRPVLVIPRNIELDYFFKQFKDLDKNVAGFGKNKLRILLSTDFSEPSKHALSYAIELCQLLPIQLYVLHVIEKYSFLDIATDSVKKENIKNKKKEVVDFLEKDLGIPRCHSVRVTVRAGNSIEEILSICNAEKINLILMGTMGKRWLERLLVGSTTEAVLNRAPCPVLTVRGAKKVDIIEKKFHKIKDSLSTYDLQTEKSFAAKDANEPPQLLSKEDPHQPSHLFLGFYTPEGLINGIEQYGISNILKNKGFEQITYLVDTRNPYHQIVKIFDGKTNIAEKLIIEFAVHEEAKAAQNIIQSSKSQHFYHFLAVDWVLIQNTHETSFSKKRPRLPGQNKPGLGLAYEIFGILIMMTERLEKDGQVNRPEFYHNAFLYHERCRFPDPETEGIFLAINRDTANISLAEVSWAIEKGFLIEETTGKTFKWTGEELILPLNESLKEYFHSNYYIDNVRKSLEKRKFKIDMKGLETVKSMIFQ